MKKETNGNEKCKWEVGGWTDSEIETYKNMLKNESEKLGISVLDFFNKQSFPTPYEPIDAGIKKRKNIWRER